MTMCAVVELSSNTVTNMVMAEPTDTPYENTFLVEIIDSSKCGIGYIWSGVEFINPSPIEIPELFGPFIPEPVIPPPLPVFEPPVWIEPF